LADTKRPHVFRVVSEDIEQGRALLLQALERRGGNVRAAAHDLCVSRRHLYRVLSRVKLWEQVDALRAERRRRRETPWKK